MVKKKKKKGGLEMGIVGCREGGECKQWYGSEGLLICHIIHREGPRLTLVALYQSGPLFSLVMEINKFNREVGKQIHIIN